jgi:archaemetzincin
MAAARTLPVPRWIGPLLLAAVLVAIGPRAHAGGVRGTVRLLVLRGFPAELEDAVEAKLADELQVRVTRVAEPRPMPKAAWYPTRKRWRADTLLEFLPGLAGPSPLGAGERVLGLASDDISVTKGPYPDWGVFGFGDMPGDAAVVSIYRLRHGADAATLTRRVAIIAAHEIGHTFGLPHCTEVGCVMLDAEGGITNTDTGTGHLGPHCREKLEALAPAG